MTSIESIVKLIENQQKQIEELRTTINSNKVKYRVIRICSISVGDPLPFFTSFQLPQKKESRYFFVPAAAHSKKAWLPAPSSRFRAFYWLRLPLNRFAGSGSSSSSLLKGPAPSSGSPSQCSILVLGSRLQADFCSDFNTGALC